MNVLVFLDDKTVAIDLRLAFINALGWNFNGKSNFDYYLNYIVSKYKNITKENYKKKCSAEELICLAYIKALDNYFMVDEALEIAELAIKKDRSKSFSIHIIYGLIKAQFLFDSDWCLTYKATEEIRNNYSLDQDMKPEAMEIIFEYMDLYKTSCN